MTGAMVEQLARALLMGEPLKLPERLYAGLRGPSGDLTLERQPVKAGSWAWNGGRADSGVDIVFPEAAADMGMATHAVLFDAPTGGREVVVSRLDEPQDVRKRTIIEIPKGALTVTWRK